MQFSIYATIKIGTRVLPYLLRGRNGLNSEANQNAKSSWFPAPDHKLRKIHLVVLAFGPDESCSVMKVLEVLLIL
jgi:hypothetical protein